MVYSVCLIKECSFQNEKMIDSTIRNKFLGFQKTINFPVKLKKLPIIKPHFIYKKSWELFCLRKNIRLNVCVFGKKPFSFKLFLYAFYQAGNFNRRLSVTLKTKKSKF